MKFDTLCMILVILMIPLAIILNEPIFFFFQFLFFGLQLIYVINYFYKLKNGF